MATTATRPRPYRDFLTPALHRRFTNASLLTLALSFIIAVWSGQYHYIWQWFPLGFAGIRTLLNFLSALTVFILRVSRTHVGTRTTTSRFETFWKSLFSASTYLTFLWYTLSAFIFCEAYLFHRPPEAKMAIIDPGRAHERARLNARCVYFRTMFLCLGILQAVLHLFSDKDRVPYPLRAGNEKTATANDQSAVAVKPALVQLRQVLFQVTTRAGTLAVSFPSLGSIIYRAFLENWAWNKAFTYAHFFYSLPAAQRMHITSLAPYADLAGRMFCETFLMVFLWEFVNAVFSAYMSQEPLKKGNPLTNDSKDPNGSLIAGLKAKKEFAKATAFLELAIITFRFPVRRRTIYSETDGFGGSTWAQVRSLCLAEITAIRTRIAPSPVTPSSQPETEAPRSRQPISAPLKSGPIFADSPPPRSLGQKAGSLVGAVARNHGNHSGATPLKQVVDFSSQKLFAGSTRAHIAPAHLQEKASGILVQIVHSPFGMPFRQTFARRANSAIFGGGGEYSNACVTINAVDSLTKLVVESLEEDTYGQVSKNVPEIIRTYASTISAVESFLDGLGQHWTDIEERKPVLEVELLLTALREGLGACFGAFGEYLEALGMSAAEIRNFKGLISRTRGREMEKGRGSR